VNLAELGREMYSVKKEKKGVSQEINQLGMTESGLYRKVRLEKGKKEKIKGRQRHRQGRERT